MNGYSNGGQLAYSKVHFQKYQKRTLLILYLTYGGFYLSRKADSVVKSSLHEQEGFSIDQLAYLDTVYLFVYTIALACSGVLGNYMKSRYLLSIGLVCLAATSYLKSKMTSPTGFAFCQILHALFQSAGWPTCIKLIGAWVTENRGFVMGIWTTCQSLGGILGLIWGTYFMSKFSWQYAYLYHVPILLVLSVFCYLYILDDPSEIGLGKIGLEGNGMHYHHHSHSSSPHDDDDNINGMDDDSGLEKSLIASAKADNLEAQINRQKQEYSNGKRSSSPSSSAGGASKPSLMRVLMLPGVVSIGISYFFLKFLRYALLMWLPYYYEEGLHFDQAVAGYMSSSFELGGLIGTPFIGWLSDRHMKGRRDLAAACFMFLAGIMLISCIVVSGGGAMINAVCMFLVGLLVIGPDSVLSGTIAQDLGTNSGMGPQVIGTLAGLINSVGSCGSIFQSYITAVISRNWGWSVLFLMFVICALVSAFILFRVALGTGDKSSKNTWLLYYRKYRRNLIMGGLSMLLFLFFLWTQSSSLKQQTN